MRSIAVAVTCVLVGCQSDAVPVCFYDPFDSIDADRWEAIDPSAGTVAANGKLTIGLPAGATTNAGLISRDSHDLTGGFVAVDTTRYFDASPTTQHALVVARDSDNYFSFAATDTSFVLRVVHDGTPDDVIAPIDRAALKWRIQHVEATAVIVFDAAAAEREWVPQRTVALPFTIDAMTVRLEAIATNGGPATASTVELDNVVFASPGCSVVEASPHQP